VTPPVVEAPAPPQEAVDRGERRIPFGSYVVGSVGVVSTALGIALLQHGNAIQEELDGTTIDADRKKLEDDKSSTRTSATVAFVVGGAGLVGAIVWAIVAPSYSKTAGTSPSIAVGPGHVGIAGRF
jgi:hypothetical protein